MGVAVATQLVVVPLCDSRQQMGSLVVGGRVGGETAVLPARKATPLEVDDARTDGHLSAGTFHRPVAR